ncbi:MAG: hypothetical protein JWO03_3455 [Bacteroidetes bacterium]|nr:hypothetical protein [Bacteroidota bacterium]
MPTLIRFRLPGTYSDLQLFGVRCFDLTGKDVFVLMQFLPDQLILM